MSVLIKCMKMPNKCEECPLSFRQQDSDQGGCVATNYYIYRKWGKGKPDWCPLVEVPTPHGRLIDENAILQGEGRYMVTLHKEAILVDTIKAAPTVIEAEE